MRSEQHVQPLDRRSQRHSHLLLLWPALHSLCAQPRFELGPAELAEHLPALLSLTPLDGIYDVRDPVPSRFLPPTSTPAHASAEPRSGGRLPRPTWRSPSGCCCSTSSPPHRALPPPHPTAWIRPAGPAARRLAAAAAAHARCSPASCCRSCWRQRSGTQGGCDRRGQERATAGVQAAAAGWEAGTNRQGRSGVR